MSGVIGVISDTHGLVRPEAISALGGSDLIVHAGDIGNELVLEQLRRIAPVVAVRGNNDYGEWAKDLPEIEVVHYAMRHFYVLHNVAALDIDSAGVKVHAVIAGHSHRTKVEEKEGILYFNPGSAGPRRFKLPVTLGKIRIYRKQLTAEVFELNV